MIINAEGHILGKLSAFAAKQALLGEEVIVVNVEKAVVSGNRDMVFKSYMDRLKWKNKMNYRKGPFHQKRPDKFVRKTIRGMLPFKKTRGREAYKRIMTYIGIPEDEIKRAHNLDIKNHEIENLDNIRKEIRGVTVDEICKFIGGK
ncbi:50S ribosomal protein L13 [Candidatus Altiarchaeales archaeon WOR_SM1_SCG]|nr:50S ribosomal protein L13 [Candidatus Altiarchaeales archaeon WOR_SM1_SCG]